MDPAAELPSLAGYRIEAVAGRGGMGVVYRAVQEGLGRPVALKLIAPELARDEEFRARFVRESRLAASLDHPHVIPVYEAGDQDGSLYIAMRWVDGPDLRELVAADGPLAPVHATALVAQVAGALDAAHARGLVHRDVKPANVLIAAGGHAYLSDFGLARSEASSDGLTRTGSVIGTASYSSPEQIEGRPVDRRADVYALACVLWFALTGAPPFRRETELATAWAQVHEAPPPAPGVAPALDAALRRGLAKDPAERPGTAGDFARAAVAAADGAPTVGGAAPAEGGASPVGGGRAPGGGASPVGGAPTRRMDASHTVRLERTRGRRRRVRPWVAGLLAVAAAAAVIAVLSLGGDDPEPAAKRPPATAPATTTTPATTAPPAAPTTPDVAGLRLDDAQELLDARGIDQDTDGGGAFGVVVIENWTVCETVPAAGKPLPEPSMTLVIARDC